MMIRVNGREVKVDRRKVKGLTYETLCTLAWKDAALQPTVGYDVGYRSGTVLPGQEAPMADGGIYNVAYTGGA